MIDIKKDTIFVSIASYRDTICSYTLKNLYETAEKPENVYVGICQQNKPEDEDCTVNFDTKFKKYSNNVRIMRIQEYEAKGPTYARYLCSTLWNGEEFFFQIDSHTKFIKNWDTKLIQMFKKLKQSGVPKPVISHYPPSIDEYNENGGNTMVPRMCKSFFNERGMISFLGSEVRDSNNEPYRTPYTASGMMFCEHTMLSDLPYDPELPYLFVGEEILHSIRYFTNGYDIYTPSENIVFHEYTRADKPKIWTDNPYYSDVAAFEKTKKYLKLEDKDKPYELPDDLKNNIEKYGLGKVRTLEEYYTFAGIDIVNKTVTSNFCKPNNLETDNIKESFTNFNKNKQNKQNKQNKNKSKKMSCSLLAYYMLIMIIILIILNLIFY